MSRFLLCTESETDPNKMDPDIGGVIDTAAIVNQATELKRLSASVAFDQTHERKIQRC